MHERWIVKPDVKISLDDIDPASTVGAPTKDGKPAPSGGAADRKATDATIASLYDEVGKIQAKLWAENKRSLLIVLQAMDAGGKDGTIKHVFKEVNPQGVRVTSFKEPNALELRHDFLWRVHRVTPAAGEIGIFNRSHYEDVLTVRVHQLVPESVWRERFELINDFEKNLHHAGTTIVKLFLHISKDEQRKRLERRLVLPEKNWKFSESDLKERNYWDDYHRAYEDVLNLTSTHHAPWFVIPANNKWYRNWAVLQILVATLRKMNPEYPEHPDLSNVTVPK